MPEFPDVTVYIEALSERVLNQPIQKIRIGSPFVLRSFDPPIGAAEGKKVLGASPARQTHRFRAGRRTLILSFIS